MRICNARRTVPNNVNAEHFKTKQYTTSISISLTVRWFGLCMNTIRFRYFFLGVFNISLDKEQSVFLVEFRSE